MNTTTTTARRAALTVALATMCGATLALPAAASEPRPQSVVSRTTAYSEPNPALGGMSLAAYVARHHEHVLGPART
jgi:hypothetical protein